MDKMLRIQEVIEITGLSRQGIYAKIRKSTFPRGYKMGGRASGWKESEIKQWLDNLPPSSATTFGR